MPVNGRWSIYAGWEGLRCVSRCTVVASYSIYCNRGRRRYLIPAADSELSHDHNYVILPDLLFCNLPSNIVAARTHPGRGR